MQGRSTLVALVLLGGCSSGPKYKIDDNSLASIPIEQKQGILGAQNEQNIAREEARKWKADLANIDREIDIASNEYKAAKLSRDTAELNKKAGDAAGDVNRKNAAAHDLQVAELGVKAADAKVDWLEKKRKWIKESLEAAEVHLTAADSKYELEKARVAQQAGMKPSEDFSLANFETESMEKNRRYTEARFAADRRKTEVDQLEFKWKSLDQQFASAKNPQAAQQSPPQQ